MNRLTVALMLVVSAYCPSIFAQTPPPAKTPAQLSQAMTDILPAGMKGRMTWIEWGASRTVWVVDSDSGVCRCLTPADKYPSSQWNCIDPQVTADGSRVIFTNDVTNTAYVVNWDGTHLRAFGGGYTDDYYYDQNLKKDFGLLVNGDAQLVSLDSPAVASPRTVMSSNVDFDDGVTICPDGTHMAFFTLSPRQPTIAVVPNGKATVLSSDGCVMSIAPDNSYEAMHQLGRHDSVRVYKSDGSFKQDIGITRPLYDSLQKAKLLATWAPNETVEHDRTSYSNMRTYMTTTFRFTSANPWIIRLSSTGAVEKYCSIHDYTTSGIFPEYANLMIYPRPGGSAIGGSRALRSSRASGRTAMNPYSIDGRKLSGSVISAGPAKASHSPRGMVIHDKQGVAGAPVVLP